MTALDCPVCGARGVTDDRCPRCAAELAELRVLATLQPPVPTPPAEPALPLPAIDHTPIRSGFPLVAMAGLALVTGLAGVMVGRLTAGEPPGGSARNATLEASASLAAGSVASASAAAPGLITDPASASPAGNLPGSASPAPRIHVVRRGESPWTIARTYYGLGRLYPRLGLPTDHAVLQPGDRVIVDPSR